MFACTLAILISCPSKGQTCSHFEFGLAIVSAGIIFPRYTCVWLYSILCLNAILIETTPLILM